MDRDDELVIELHAPPSPRRLLRLAIGFLALGLIEVALGARVGMVLLALGLALIIVLVWAIPIFTRNRRFTLTATREQVAVPAGSLAWRDVESMWIGNPMSNASVRWFSPGSLSGLRALNIEARTGVRVTRSKTATALVRVPALRIVEGSLDRSLEQLARDLERLAGRPLLRGVSGSERELPTG